MDLGTAILAGMTAPASELAKEQLRPLLYQHYPSRTQAEVEELLSKLTAKEASIVYQRLTGF